MSDARIESPARGQELRAPGQRHVGSSESGDGVYLRIEIGLVDVIENVKELTKEHSSQGILAKYKTFLDEALADMAGEARRPQKLPPIAVEGKR